MHILTLFLLLALRIEHFFCKNETRPNKKVGRRTASSRRSRKNICQAMRSSCEGLHPDHHSRMASAKQLWCPGLPIRNTRYAYNSRSHDQCVVNPHIRVDNRITSSITVPNSILTIGHMTKHDIASQGESPTKQWIPSSVDDPRHAYYPTGN
jgi:hypothetical protein